MCRNNHCLWNKVHFIDPEPLNVSTFAPLPQAVSISHTFIILSTAPEKDSWWHFLPHSPNRLERQTHWQVNDDKKYVDFGYVPCNGHVPCQPAHLSPENVISMLMMLVTMVRRMMMMTSMIVIMMTIRKPQLAERMEGAEPCHDYKDKGSGPEGCW